MESKLIIGATLIAVGFLLYRVFAAPSANLRKNLDKEINEVLTKDEYKAKGRFE